MEIKMIALSITDRSDNEILYCLSKHQPNATTIFLSITCKPDQVIYVGKQENKIIDQQIVSDKVLNLLVYDFLSWFFFSISSTLDVAFYKQLDGCFKKTEDVNPNNSTWHMHPIISEVRVNRLPFTFEIFHV